MSLNSAPSGGVPPLTSAVWLWPAAAAALAAWPVWRSMFPEFSDIGEGWFRLQPILGLSGALLFLGWLLRMRRSIANLWYSFWSLASMVSSAAIAIFADQDSVVDLAALAISWTVPVSIFASMVLLRVREAGVLAGSKAPARATLWPPMVWLHISVAALYLVVLYAAPDSQRPLATIGAISPGLILAWAALSDTARFVLSRRQVYFAEASDLLALTKRRRWLLRAPTILVTDRVKLVSLHPAADIKPGELVGLAAATTMDEESEISRAIQEFGVSHRIRLPALRQRHDGPAAAQRRAMLAHGATVELCELDETLDLAAHVEAIDLARAQHRTPLALVERAPNPRVLGLMVFAIGARPGAQEALRLLRDRKIGAILTAPPRDAADELALKSLRIGNRAEGATTEDTTAILRGAQAVSDESGLTVSFGTQTAHGLAHIVVAREDARALVDLARFADDFRIRTWVVTLLASAPGLVLIAAAFGYVPATPFLVTGVAVIGIVIATVTPQVLRLSPVLDNEGTED